MPFLGFWVLYIFFGAKVFFVLGAFQICVSSSSPTSVTSYSILYFSFSLPTLVPPISKKLESSPWNVNGGNVVYDLLDFFFFKSFVAMKSSCLQYEIFNFQKFPLFWSQQPQYFSKMYTLPHQSNIQSWNNERYREKNKSKNNGG